jgi:hypothetical protein
MEVTDVDSHLSSRQDTNPWPNALHAVIVPNILFVYKDKAVFYNFQNIKKIQYRLFNVLGDEEVFLFFLTSDLIPRIKYTHPAEQKEIMLPLVVPYIPLAPHVYRTPKSQPYSPHRLFPLPIQFLH